MKIPINYFKLKIDFNHVDIVLSTSDLSDIFHL